MEKIFTSFWWLVFINFLGTIFAWLRLAGLKGEIYQALAHLFVGGLFVGCCTTKVYKYLYWILFLYMCGIETFAFFLLGK